jgi:hypothetical protein
MIESSIVNDNPTGLSGYCDKLIGMVVSVPLASPVPAFALVVDPLCCICVKVFGGGTELQNDKYSFLFKKAIAADTIVFKLLKDDIEVATLNDNTLGVFSDFGTWTTHTGQSLYTGFVIDFDLVYDAHGEGNYNVRAEHNVLGNAYNVDSETLTLKKYADQLADETVKFQWTQNGRIRSNQFNYTGMDWIQYIRVEGKLSGWQPTLIKDSVVYSNYRVKQVQDQIENKYTFESFMLKSWMTKLLCLDMMLADSILVTDFNLFNHRKDYLAFELRQDEISNFEEVNYTENAILALQFTDRFENNIKQGS